MNIARKYTGEERVTIMDTNILLENGTNELEVLEFTLAGNHYGINVAKIREILTYQPVTPIPNAHPSVEGIFMPRDTMISVINLRNCLGLPDIDRDGLFIITNFNKRQSVISLDSSGESSATIIGESLLLRSSKSSKSDTCSPVSGLISVTIFSKSRITISRSSNLITPVDTPFSSILMVASGVMISAQESL